MIAHNHPTARQIAYATCEVTQVPFERFLSFSREARAVGARRMYAWVGHQMGRYSYTELAGGVGRKAHSSVIAQYRIVQKRVVEGGDRADKIVKLANDIWARAQTHADERFSGTCSGPCGLIVGIGKEGVFDRGEL